MIKLADPDIGAEELEEIARVVRSGRLVQAKEVETFERAVVEIVGTEEVVAVSSGTAALFLSLMALEIKPGDEVIVPAYTYPATANVVVHAGARPVFADVTMSDLNIDPAAIEPAISEKTKAIIPVHLFGLPAAMADVRRIAAAHNLWVIEDAACALGAECDGGRAGSLGDLGCFSFHARKLVTTGEGGAVSTGNTAYAAAIRTLRNHGAVASDDDVDFAFAGYNLRMSEIHAAFGVAQLGRFEQIVRRRAEIAHAYDGQLQSLEEVKLIETPARTKRVYQTYVVLLSEKLDRDVIIADLAHQDIEAGIGTYAVPAISYYKDMFGTQPEDYPNALAAYRRSLALPLSSKMENRHVDRVSSALKSAIAKQLKTS